MKNIKLFIIFAVQISTVTFMVKETFGNFNGKV